MPHPCMNCGEPTYSGGGFCSTDCYDDHQEFMRERTDLMDGEPGEACGECGREQCGCIVDELEEIEAQEYLRDKKAVMDSNFFYEPPACDFF